MIIEGLMAVVFGLFQLLTMPISIPGLPEGVRNVVTSALEYISVGVSLLANFCDIGYLVTLFGVIVAVDAGMLIYKFILWVIKKIPMIGIE